MTSYTIGIDLGGTILRIRAYTRGFGLLETNQLSTGLHEARGMVIRDICQEIRSLRDRYSVGCSLEGIAIGSPGPIELPDGRCVASRIPLGGTASSFAQRSNERWKCPSPSRRMPTSLP